MQELIESLNLAVQQAKFDIGRSRTVTLDRFQQIYLQDRTTGDLTAASATANVPEDILEDCIRILRPLVNPFLDLETDRIGIRLVQLMGGLSQPTMGDFSRSLVRAAAILESERVAQIIYDWAEGKPLFYQEKALLTGVSIAQELVLEGGIHLCELPKSEYELAAHLPHGSLAAHGYMNLLLGNVVLSIDCEVAPALFTPSSDDASRNDFTRVWASDSIPEFSFDGFLEALSLASNGCIRGKYFWQDFGDLKELNNSAFPGMSFVDIPKWGSSVELQQEHLVQARDIYLQRHRRGEANRSVDLAIQRWMNSKKSENTLANQYIELRVGLEALYLKDGGGEKAYRLASNGAWHLGKEFSERKKYYTLLKKFYNLASDAIHARNFPDGEGQEELLKQTQDVCREGIVRRISESREPPWDDLVLGREM